jgi:hypothetical protein
MTDRASSLLEARRERLERILGRRLVPPAESREPLSAEARSYLMGEGESLYWNDLEWEHITDEEALEEGPITQMTFPGFLAFVRGLLLYEVMPDSQAPANPRPQVVEGLLRFLAGRVVELEQALAAPGDAETDRLRTGLDVTSHLIDLVLYLIHDVGPEDIERIEAAR